jgi:Raf kinase inhibitor-like YbhB/YbcL family protein
MKITSQAGGLLAAGYWILTAGCMHSQNNIGATRQEAIPVLTEFKLTSPAFKEGTQIPALYSCDSANISPALTWNKPSANVVSYTLIMDDPDAPMGTWVHWIVFNIPGTYTSLPDHFRKDSLMNSGIRQGKTSFGTQGYGGPCPPEGIHRYYFKLFALDTALNLPCATTGEKKLIEIMKGHIIAETSLMGKYFKKQ